MVVHLIVLRPVPYKMAWDATRLTVEAGRPVEVVIDNNDEMPHNFVLLAPGSMEEVGTAAEAMAADPAGYGKEFIPDGAAGRKILHHSKLLQPKEEQRLRFKAPDQPGDYPYICSFPGHYKTMNGMMHVVGKK